MKFDGRVMRQLAVLDAEGFSPDLWHETVAEGRGEEEWQGSSDSNRGPSVLETDALTS